MAEADSDSKKEKGPFPKRNPGADKKNKCKITKCDMLHKLSDRKGAE